MPRGDGESGRVYRSLAVAGHIFLGAAARTLGWTKKLPSPERREYSATMAYGSDQQSNRSKYGQEEYVEPDRKTSIKYLFWLAAIIATPILVTAGLSSIVFIGGSLWLILWLSIQLPPHEEFSGWPLALFIAGGFIFVGASMFLVLDVIACYL